MQELVLNRQQVRRIDEIAIRDFAMPGVVLMENAGRGCVAALQEFGVAGAVVICIGRGNNGGDGFVIARHLQILGVPCKLVLFCDPADIRGDALINLQIVQKTSIPRTVLPKTISDEEIRNELSAVAGQPTAWIVDALLGTGASGPVRPPLDLAVAIANQIPCKRMAVDIPTGLDCDTGQIANVAFRAHLTCTFVALKPGLLCPEAQPYVGKIKLIDIGVPPEVISQMMVT